MISASANSQESTIKTSNQQLFDLFMRRMLPAAPAKLLQLDAIRSRLAILGRRVIALLALTALHCDDLSGHFNNSWLLGSYLLTSCF
jgi:hypothetical protein